MITRSSSTVSVSPIDALVRMGLTDTVDELRVIIMDERKVSAYFTFTSQIGAGRYQLRLFGRKNGLVVDQAHRTVLRVYGRSYKLQLNYLLPPLAQAQQYLSESLGNARRFVAGSLRMDSGLSHLIRLFYLSVQRNEPPPIHYEQILMCSRIIESVIQQMRDGYGGC